MSNFEDKLVDAVRVLRGRRVGKRRGKAQAWTGREVGGPTSGLYRRVTPRILLPGGRLPAHLVEPTTEEAATYERRRAEILRRGGKPRRAAATDQQVSAAVDAYLSTRPPEAVSYLLKMIRDDGLRVAGPLAAFEDRLRRLGFIVRHGRNARGQARIEVTLPDRRGGKRRYDPAQLAKGTAEELEHAATIRKIQRNPRLPVKKAAELIAKDHLKKHPRQYDRLDAVEVPRRRKGLKVPRLKLLHRSGRLRVYLVDSHAVRKLYGDWTMGGHHRVYPDFIPPREVWIAEEVFDPERKLCTLHELNEYKLMGGGQDYDTAHDASTALEQSFRKHGMKGLDAALKRALRAAAAS